MKLQKRDANGVLVFDSWDEGVHYFRSSPSSILNRYIWQMLNWGYTETEQDEIWRQARAADTLPGRIADMKELVRRLRTTGNIFISNF